MKLLTDHLHSMPSHWLSDCQKNRLRDFCRRQRGLLTGYLKVLTHAPTNGMTSIIDLMDEHYWSLVPSDNNR